ncbi:hypothetical protein [Streptomyces sp. enrichment culture]|uniref:hypothetical protein n=1 Tax=Streptomyces sp. enrichment culture TaxID=1795815 RepID=UPI003F5755F2
MYVLDGRGRCQQLALSDSQTTTVNTRIGKELANVIPAPRDASMTVRDVTQSSAGKQKPANGELVDTSTGAVCTAGDEVQEVAQERQECPAITMPDLEKPRAAGSTTWPDGGPRPLQAPHPWWVTELTDGGRPSSP